MLVSLNGYSQSTDTIYIDESAIDVEVNENDSLFIQADGEIIGSGGFKATIIPRVFSFYS